METEELEGEVSEGEEDEPGTARRRFRAVAHNIALIKAMQKKTISDKLMEGLYRPHTQEEELFSEEFEEQEFTKELKEDDFEKIEERPLLPEVPKDYTEEPLQSITFISPDVRDEYARQIKGQIIVFVKKRLHDYEMELQHIKGNVTTTKKKVSISEKHLKDLAEKLQFLDSNFNQRSGDLAALRKMAENHQMSIVTVMHHLDRKAEAYAVNQKVGKEELTVIEDRVLKLCAAAYTEMTKMEKNIDQSIEKFHFELDKKLSNDDFECRLESLLHKIKILESKLKDMSTGPPNLDFKGLRPLEIKKYVLERTKSKQPQNISGKTKSSSEVFIPAITQHHTDREVAPKSALQVQKELELASHRESKRYVQGAYTKIKGGKK